MSITNALIWLGKLEDFEAKRSLQKEIHESVRKHMKAHQEKYDFYKDSLPEGLHIVQESDEVPLRDAIISSDKGFHIARHYSCKAGETAYSDEGEIQFVLDRDWDFYFVEKKTFSSADLAWQKIERRQKKRTK